MTTTTRGWVDAAVAAADYRLTGAIFELGEVTLARERAYDNVHLLFAARGRRLVTEGGFELANVHACLLDASGAVIVRRGHDSYRQSVVGAVVRWGHELADDHLDRAVAVVYDVETRLDLRRPLVRGQFGGLDLDREDRQPLPFTAAPLPRDPLMEVGVALAFRRNEIEINLVAESALAHDGHASYLDFDVLDEAGEIVGSRALSLSIRAGDRVGFADAGLRIEKRVQREMRGFALRGRSEVRALTRVGPLRLAR